MENNNQPNQIQDWQVKNSGSDEVIELPKVKRGSKILSLLGVVAALVLVTGIAAASYFVSNRLSGRMAVAPNAPESEPMAADPPNTYCTATRIGYSCSESSTERRGHCTAVDVCAYEEVRCYGCVDRWMPLTKTCTEWINECTVDEEDPPGEPGTRIPCGNVTCSPGLFCLNNECVSGIPHGDPLRCGTQNCNALTEVCCNEGCFTKEDGCPSGVPPKDKDACWFDSISQIKDRTFMPGDTLPIIGWGGLCKNQAILPSKVTVSLCNPDGSNCQILKDTLTRNDRSESEVAQVKLCRDNPANPGTNNTLGFNDSVVLPTNLTPNTQKIVKINIVSTDPAVRISNSCEAPIITVGTPTLSCDSWTSVWINNCKPLSEYQKSPRSEACITRNDEIAINLNNPKATEMRFRSTKELATLCTDADNAKFNTWTAWETYKTTKTVKMTALGATAGSEFKVCAQFRNLAVTSASCGAIIEKIFAPKCVVAKVYALKNNVWTSVENKELKAGMKVRFGAMVDLSTARKARFKINGGEWQTSENKMTVDNNIVFYLEHTLKSGNYSVESEIQ